MATCIYCENEEASSQEHILQNSFGAMWESKNILCNSCNNLFGRTIDRSLSTEFVFFRNLLSIKGKRGDIPLLHIENESGEKITRDGLTGDITTNCKPEIEEVENGNGTYTISTITEIPKTNKIYQDIEKGVRRRGDKIISTNITGYKADSAKALKDTISFSLPTWVALRKSLINYWCYFRREIDTEQIFHEAKKIHEFSCFCEKNKDHKSIAEFAKELGIDGFPLSVRMSEIAKLAISNNYNLYNSLFLVPKNGSLFGGICLFSTIHWGFEISSTTSLRDRTIVSTMDIESGTIIKSFDDVTALHASEFDFKFSSNKERLQIMEGEFSNLMQICARHEHVTAIRNAIEATGIKDRFPITDQSTIEDILFERAVLIFGFVFVEYGIRPDFFKTDVGRSQVKPVVTSFLRQIGKNLVLNVDTYNMFIYGCWEFAQDMASQGFINYFSLLDAHSQPK